MSKKRCGFCGLDFEEDEITETTLKKLDGGECKINTCKDCEEENKKLKEEFDKIPKPVVCSFCEKQSQKLFTSNGVCICEDCVKLAHDLFE
uniref:ATP-dependent Clp protease ATP-binding subunit ClpX zinc ribbon domain-containing protein n=1 Tax=candidate division CPR3 bacterium TaxID=2268181 RepID=A0A7C4RB15_UNCC3